MNITPRKDETAVVVELLESEDYDSADQLAKAIIKAVHGVMLERDWYVAGFRFESGSPYVAWGPFATEGETTKYLQKLALPGPAQMGVVKVYSPARQRRADAEQIKKAQPVFCRRCGHPAGTHEHDGRKNLCQYRGCRCDYLVREES